MWVVVVLDVGLLLAALDLVQRWLRDVDVAALDEFGHLPVEKREQQSAYVASVNVRISHETDAVIAQLADIEIVAADPATQRGDQRADFGRRQHLVEARSFDIEDLTLERQDRLRAPIAALLGGPAGGVALDDEDFRQRRILLLTVGELAGKTRDVQCALAPGHLARFAGRLAPPAGLGHLRAEGGVFLRMF